MGFLAYFLKSREMIYRRQQKLATSQVDQMENKCSLRLENCPLFFRRKATVVAVTRLWGMTQKTSKWACVSLFQKRATLPILWLFKAGGLFWVKMVHLGIVPLRVKIKTQQGPKLIFLWPFYNWLYLCLTLISYYHFHFEVSDKLSLFIHSLLANSKNGQKEIRENWASASKIQASTVSAYHPTFFFSHNV